MLPTMSPRAIHVLFIVTIRVRFKFSGHDRRVTRKFHFDRRCQQGSRRFGIMVMAIAGAAHCGSEAGRLRAGRLKSLAPKLLVVGATLCAIAVAGCARQPPQRELQLSDHEVKAAAPARAVVRVRRHSEPQRYAELKIRRPDPALLSPQPEPDCEFRRSDLKTVDPDEWARLKVEYERLCYQVAERTARERLSLLQTSIEPSRARAPVE
jgi:hypothetical protein